MMDKKYLIVNDNVSNKALDKIKKIIAFVKFDNTKILFDTYDKLPNDITSKDAVILITCVTNDDGKSYSQIFLEEEIYHEQIFVLNSWTNMFI